MSPQENTITKMIKAKINQKDPSAEIILFGSHARGEANKKSDWDILILINKQDPSRLIERELRGEIFDIELDIGEPISTFVFSKTEWEQKYKVTPFYQNIKREGIYL
jgi:predicted nucleotidyltransferase